jgi:hypothetical protein
MLKEGIEINVRIPEIEELKVMLETFMKFERKCIGYMTISESEGEYLKDILKLREEVNEIGITNKNIREF